MSADYDVAIIGAGPSGIAAALALAERGVGRVIVLEREAEAGGIPRHCGHQTFGLSEFGWLMSGPSYARRLVAKANASAIEISTRTSVLALKAGGELTLTHPDTGIKAIGARKSLSIGQIHGIEGEAAIYYFAAWRGIQMKWRLTKRSLIPSDWHRIVPRRSPLGKSNKNARQRKR
jgi:glycine/D-amino acid oxidase-like deaminating enzyme